MIERATIILIAAGLCGCSTTPPALYVLRPASVEATAPAQARTLALREVVLPSYARDARLAQRRPDGAVVHQEEHRWADTPARTITRTLADSLRAVGGASVVAEPWSPRLAPDATVTVEFDVVHATPGGTAELLGRTVVSRPNEQARHAPFDISVPVAGPAIGDAMQALAEGLLELARQIARISAESA